MTDIHNVRPSQRETQEANREATVSRQHAAAAHQASDRMWTEVQADWSHRFSSWQHSGQAVLNSAGEWIHDRQVEAGRTIDRVGVQASHVVEDPIVNARRSLRGAQSNLDRELDRRERELYPESTPATRIQRTLATSAPVHRDAPAQHPAPARPGHDAAGRPPATQSEHPRATGNAHPEHATTDSVAPNTYRVRRGDNLSSIVRADEARRHPGVRNARQEQLRVDALVNQYGETILPGMQIILH